MTQRVYALVGVNWGTQGSHPLPPQTVVRMLKANNIKHVKLFDSDSSVLRALANTGIEVMVAIPNELLITMTDATQANLWVQNNVVRYIPAGTKIRYVAVGNEPYLAAYNGTFIASTYPALRNIQLALNNAKMGDVKATVPLNADVLSAATTPSGTVFRPDVASNMMQICAFLAQNECPFTINIYPFLSLYGDKNFPVDYAFFDRHASPVPDGEYTYYNVFDASFDSLVVALTKAGYANMSIIVGEIGWPTDGDVNANLDYAERFNQGMINHLNNGGTPRRPNTAIDYYLFSLIDEDMKSVAPGNFERHWGIFRYDGRPKYALSVSGANGKTLVAATGVRYLKSRWCVLNTNVTGTSTSTLADSISYACANADCTALGYGCSCNRYLDATGNASYAFNAYFQRQNQEVGACSFGGLGRIVTTNPSVNNCEYIIQLAYGSSSTSSTSNASWKQTSTFLLALILLVNTLL